MLNKKLKMLSWNVNGLRAVAKKGFMDWLKRADPDILCLQETKLQDPGQLPHAVLHPERYATCWNCATEKKGYSGTAIFSKQPPSRFITEFGQPILNQEGRIIGAEYTDFILFCVYFPNGKMGPHRLEYKMNFYAAFLQMIDGWVKKGKSVIFCGDVNTAHTELDLARPKANEKISGFLPREREWIDNVIAHGYLDTFRLFEVDGGHYSWWDMLTRARARDIGWRIDYFFVSRDLKDRVERAFILKDVMGSDHCPVGIEFF